MYQPEKPPKWLWVVGVLFLLILIDKVADKANSNYAAEAYDGGYRANKGNIQEYERYSRSGQRPSEKLPSGVLMDERERALFDADPSSMGYTAEDRAFLKEHGVTEAEARAAESLIGNPD